MIHADMETVSRIRNLSSDELLRFMIAVWGDNDQWYWSEIETVERSAMSITFIAYHIQFNFFQTLYGVELYDDLGHLIGEGIFHNPQHVINGDRFQGTYRLEFNYGTGASSSSGHQQEGDITDIVIQPEDGFYHQ